MPYLRRSLTLDFRPGHSSTRDPGFWRAQGPAGEAWGRRGQGRFANRPYLGPALFEAARQELYLHGLGELLGPPSLEEPCAQGLRVRGGASRRKAHGVDWRQVPVQEPGQQPRQVGVAAPYGREGLHRGREARDDAAVFYGQVRVRSEEHTSE